ncbi:MAG: TIGR04552 family protein [Deltaproteobacteria bacterium]
MEPILDQSFRRLVPLAEMGLQDVEVLRLILRGGSVVDWRRLNFRDRAEVDRYLRLALFDPTDPIDERRLREILAQAVSYLRTSFRYRVAEPVANPRELHDLFLMASGRFEPQRWRRIACVVLKVMHCIHHVEARELLFQAKIAEADFQALIDARIVDFEKQMRLAGFPLVEMVGNLKSRESLITKLLSKKETLAAQIYDKVRYRIVTRRLEEVLPVLHHLATNLFPFNFVVPGQTQNLLVSFRDVLEGTPSLRKLIPKLELDLDLERREDKARRKAGELNAFSADAYRVLNLVADVPVRLDSWVEPDEDGRFPHGRIAFGLVEFQIVDEETARENEKGEASHERYKARQKAKVLRRLSRGLVVPKPSARS